jgi:hypothetical protein
MRMFSLIESDRSASITSGNLSWLTDRSRRHGRRTSSIAARTTIRLA